MEVAFDLRKSLPDNAKGHYERAKKLKDKIPGLQIAIRDSRRKLESAAVEAEIKPEKMVRKPERKWFEKFRWFETTNGMLVLGGRDATTNEILVKKHLEPKDLVFHADVTGAPFFIVKNPEGLEVPDEVRREAATAAASYSRLWASGTGSADVFEVDPEQVSKTPPAGEYLTKGAFMIYGQKRWHKGVLLKAAIGLTDDGVIGGPIESVSAKTREYVIVQPGDTPTGQLVKKIKVKLGEKADLDDIQRFLPAGGARVV
jgi:predicted ribosome quality control (RQC) complex YloA/Tae2 family protein